MYCITILTILYYTILTILYYNYTVYADSKAKAAYNSVLRLIFKVPWFHDGVVYSASALFVRNNLRNYATTIRKLVHGFRTRKALTIL